MNIFQLEQFRDGLSIELTNALLQDDVNKIRSLKAILLTFDTVFTMSNTIEPKGENENGKLANL